jgi:hypothetical protein
MKCPRDHGCNRSDESGDWIIRHAPPDSREPRNRLEAGSAFETSLNLLIVSSVRMEPLHNGLSEEAAFGRHRVGSADIVWASSPLNRGTISFNALRAGCDSEFRTY